MIPLKKINTPLHLINNLLAVVSKSDPQLYEEIKKAIEFTESPQLSPSTTVLHKLLGLYSQNDVSVGFHHWNMLGTKDLDPLWLRSHFLKILEVLKPFERSLIIVTNLQAALTPPHPHSMNCKQAIDYLQDLSLTEAQSDKSLNLLFL